MAATSQRGIILDAYAARLAAYYGPDGTLGHWLRAVHRRAWQPAASTRPVATIEDSGQRRMEGEDTQDENARMLSVSLVFDLAEDWAKTTAYATWTDRLEKIIHLFSNWCPTSGAVVVPSRYVQDTPFQVILSEAVSETIWIVEFEIGYYQGTHNDADFPEA